MHFVWSTVGYPTLYLARTTDITQCACSASTYNSSFPDTGYSNFSIPGLDSNFSLTIVFTRLIEFNVTDESYAEEVLNPAIVCNDTAFYLNSSYSDISLDDMSWRFFPDNGTFVGLVDESDTDYQNATRFSIRVSSYNNHVVSNDLIPPNTEISI